MGLESMLVHQCTVYRNQTIGTNGRHGMSALANPLVCMVAPMSDYATVSNGYEVGQTYTVMSAADADVQVTDRLDWNGKSLIVKGIKPFTGFGPMDHLECVAVTEKSNG